MKKRFNVHEVDCANCAAKMEEEINKIPGVIKASISFMAQKLTIECEDGMMDEILVKANAIMADIDDGAGIDL